jgi:hypothetical protein
MLVEKTDRLYRNLKDWVTVDDRQLGPMVDVALAGSPRKLFHALFTGCVNVQRGRHASCAATPSHRMMMPLEGA